MKKDLVTQEDVLTEMDKLAIDCAEIEKQILLAKADAYANGIYSDPLWYANANLALKIKNKDRQKLQVLLSQMKKKAKAEQNDKYERNFMNVAKMVLDKSTFESICFTAQRMSAEQP